MNAELPSEAAEVRTGDAPLLGDMAPLIVRLRALVERWPHRLQTGMAEATSSFRQRTGFTEHRTRRADVVLASQTAVELGHPRTESCALVLATWKPDVVRDGTLTCVGPDLGELRSGALHPFAQAVLLHLRPGPPPDPFQLDTLQYLMHRLPGYMVRSVPGRLWVRVARTALQRGLSLADVATALMLSYRETLPEVAGVEVVVLTGDADRVRELAPIASEASILAGRHKKLVLQPDGDVQCADLSCDACDEKPTCDALRDVVIKRRRSR